MNLNLSSKTAFISGSSQGIGLSIAKSLLSEGAQVIINGRNSTKLNITLEKLRSEYPSAKISGIAADFSNRAEVKQLLAQLPSIDILINNVGIFELKEFDQITDDDWLKMFEVNVMSSIRLSRELLPKMLKKNWGRIIFISSESGVNIPSNMIHYGTTKTAMLSISRGLAELTKNSEVTVNTILGGPTYSDGVSQTIEQMASASNQSIDVIKESIISHSSPSSLLQRFITPEEIANMVTYISSPLSSATNGAALRVDGGKLNTIL